MNQTSPNGMSYIDIAKSCVETFINKRQNDPRIRSLDRYLIVTCEDGLGAIKAGWKDNLDTLLQELKTLKAFDLTDLGTSLKKGLDLLNLYRLKSGIDSYGYGRRIWSIDPAHIYVLTDGGSLSDKNGLCKELTIPKSPVLVGSELTKEPFRWDHKIFGITLKLSNSAHSFTDSPLSKMCEVTGGKNVCSGHIKQAISLMESFAIGNSQLGVVVNFDPMYPKGDNFPSAHHKSIYINSMHPGTWPIPEDYMIAPNMIKLPPRCAQPHILYKTQPSALPVHPGDFPCDTYTLENSMLTRWIVEMSQTHNGKENICFEVFIASQNDPTGKYPFGYLKQHSQSSLNVILCVLPFNYPTLFYLLHNCQLSATAKWRQDWEKYLTSMPGYYIQPLKNVLKRWIPPSGSQNLVHSIPDSIASNGSLPYAINTKLNEIKIAADNQANVMESGIIQARQNKSPLLYKPNRVHRSGLLHLLNDTRKQLLLSSKTILDLKHSVPISKMGNYHEYLINNPKPRKVHGEEDVKPFFGSPWAKPKKSSNSPGFVDEADMNMNDLSISAFKKRRSQKRSSETSKEDSPSKKNKVQETSESNFILPPPLPRPPLPSSPNDTPHPSPMSSPQHIPSVFAMEEKENVPFTNLVVNANPEMAPPPIEANHVSPPQDTLTILRENNLVKTSAIKVIRAPSTLDREKLQTILDLLKGSRSHKTQIVKEIALIASMYKRNVGTLFDRYIEQHL